MEAENQRPLLNDNLGNADGGHGNRGNEMLEFEGDIEPINSAGGLSSNLAPNQRSCGILLGLLSSRPCASIHWERSLWRLLGMLEPSSLPPFPWRTLSLPGSRLVLWMQEGSSLSCICRRWSLGMGSALETLCGQAYGAGQLDMLGIYMQRSWVILNSTALVLCIFYVFATPFLKLIGQASEIAESAGTFAIWMIPQLFAYSTNFPITKFLQAQSKMMVMALISLVALVLHTFFSWLLIIKLGWGLVGAAVVLDSSWWFIVIAQLVYIFTGTCGRAWTGFSWKAFTHLWDLFKLSLASAIMLCLECWYYMVLILFAGYLSNPEVSVDALSICMNILGWTIMVAMGASAAISVRVSNELGAGNPRRAKFAVVVVVISTFIIGLAISAVLFILRDYYPKVFTSSQEVQALVNQLTLLLALTIVIDNVQPVLSGVAIGAGWQAIVAYVNVGCYYLFGLPLGLVMGYKLNLGVTGIWSGMTIGVALQSLILFAMTYRTNWNKEASAASERIRVWGGPRTSDNGPEK
ncbi:DETOXIFICATION 50 protein [Nymphaea thermarum]|nr:DETOXIFICATION 50 protein [Nymphaea thermarum]